MLHIDAGDRAENGVHAWWINGGDGEDARNLLSTLLTAITTMASMAFSVTVVALTLAANVYGSRLIRNFRADLRTQLVLRVFALTIVYCLIVLRSVHGKAPIPDVPHASVTVGTGMALFSVLALLVFIQGVARLMVADEVIRRVRDDIDGTIEEFDRLNGGDGPEHGPTDLPGDFEAMALRLSLPWEGYVQAIDHDGFLEWAERHDSIVRLEFVREISSSRATGPSSCIRSRPIRSGRARTSSDFWWSVRNARRHRIWNLPSATSSKWRFVRSLPA
jgi:uncharacterized membrane protein